MDKTELEESIQENLSLLSKGLLQSSISSAYIGYRNLYKIGLPVVEILKKKLLEITWEKSRYKEVSAYLSGVFSLLHDLNESEADSVRKSIIKNGCPPYTKSILDSVCSFSTKDYKQYKISGIDIFEQKSIRSKCEIKIYLEKWLGRVPKSDLEEISRLYVVSKRDIDISWASGTYTSFLFKIALLWDNSYKENSILFNLFSLSTEQTLYHEIGHHVHRHRPDQDTPDKEKEADHYAKKILLEHHPKLKLLGRILGPLGIKSKRNYFRWGL